MPAKSGVCGDNFIVRNQNDTPSGTHIPAAGSSLDMPHNRALAGILLLGLNLFVGAAFAASPEPIPGGWRLMRTPNPRGGPDAVSMTHTADLIHSDPDLAGLMLRCAQSGAELLIVVVTPFPPGAHPDVTISGGGNDWHFTGQVVPPGAELLLPPESTTLVSTAWRSARALTVKVSSPDQSFGGVIPVDGMATALATLMASCPVN